MTVRIDAHEQSHVRASCCSRTSRPTRIPFFTDDGRRTRSAKSRHNNKAEEEEEEDPGVVTLLLSLSLVAAVSFMPWPPNCGDLAFETTAALLVHDQKRIHDCCASFFLVLLTSLDDILGHFLPVQDVALPVFVFVVTVF